MHKWWGKTESVSRPTQSLGVVIHSVSCRGPEAWCLMLPPPANVLPLQPQHLSGNLFCKLRLHLLCVGPCKYTNTHTQTCTV